MFVRNAWYVAAHAPEVTGAALLARTLLDDRVVLFRSDDGAPAALADRCCHRFAPLSLGDLEPGGLRCRYHGLKFNADGQCIEIPGQADIPAAMCVRSYPVVERHGLVWIWMGEPALADPARIVDCHWNTEPDWPVARGYLHYAANYQLIADNLLDFAHLTFVHRTTLANKNFPNAQPEVTPFEGGVRLRRVIRGTPASPLHAAAGRFNGPVDFWNEQVWWLPSVFENWAGSAPPGGEVPSADRHDALHFRHFSLLTPETESTTHYFWIQPCHFPHDDASMIDTVQKGIETAFAEDRAIIEAQQKNIDADPAARMRGTRGDFALNQVRFMLQRLVKAEQKEAETPIKAQSHA